MFRLDSVSPIYRGQLLKAALVGTLVLWAVSSTWFGLQKKPERLLIALDRSVPRVIEAPSEKELQEQKWNFIKRFFFLYYNYDPENFDAHVGEASNLMSETVWSSEKAKVLQVKKRIEESGFEQRVMTNSERKIHMLEVSPNEFEVQFWSEIRERVKGSKLHVKLSVGVREHTPSERNPWAFEVGSLHEEYLP